VTFRLPVATRRELIGLGPDARGPARTVWRARGRYPALGVGTGSTARIIAVLVWHCDALPVCSISGVL
jgi:hypothetical protein